MLNERETYTENEFLSAKLSISLL